MGDDVAEVQLPSEQQDDPDEQANGVSEEITKLHGEYQSRLVAANLRTEAVRAGMIDMDGLKLIDVSAVRLGTDDRVIGGRRLMDDFRRSKPWLFTTTSSSSAAIAPASQMVRKKTALEMTDEEYTAARAAVTRYQF
jgi:hypothetical protein